MYFKFLPSYLNNYLSAWRQSALLLAAVLVVSGCSPNELEYRRNGIGSDLYSSDLGRATDNLETYFGFICQQANIDTFLGRNNYPECNYGDLESGNNWNIFVQTGFNDIDRRCDGYLAWIEEVRNREAFGTSQLNSIEALVRTISVATGEPNATALAIVGAAFGYSRELFSDYHRLLYNGLESSTIKTIVSERRLTYRIAMRDQAIEYKPDAVNVLRSYLRICMPYTITMDANTFARAEATGAILPAYTDPRLQRATLLGAEPFRAETATNTIPNRPPVVVGDGWSEVNTSGKPIDTTEAIAIQRALCFSPTKTGAGPYADGIYGPQTTAALKLFQTVFRGLSSNENWANEEINITQSRRSRLLEDGALDINGNPKTCANGGKNYLEHAMTTGRIRKLATALGAPGKSTLAEIRTEIRQYRSDNGLKNGPDDMFADQVTPELYNKLNLGSSS